MKTFSFTLVLVGLSLAALSVAAQGQTSYTLLSAEGNTWKAEGVDGTNPTLAVPANTEITVTAKNVDGGVHNIKIGSGETHDLGNLDDEATLTFTSPASGTVQYICTIHSSTMKGVFSVGGAGEEAGEKEAPGLGLVGALVALAGVALLVARRR